MKLYSWPLFMASFGRWFFRIDRLYAVVFTNRPYRSAVCLTDRCPEVALWSFKIRPESRDSHSPQLRFLGRIGTWRIHSHRSKL
jgi:hypothetical protein